MLSEVGQNLVRATSGVEALRRLLEQDFARALLDIQTPGMDGFQTAALIRARERSRHMPMIFLTAYDKSDDQISQGYELGAVDFLFKPIVPAILRAKVRAFVDLSRKTEEVKRHALLLREVEQREHDRRLQEATQRGEAERLREEMSKERRLAEALAHTVAERQRAEAALQASDDRLRFLSEMANRLMVGERPTELLRLEAYSGVEPAEAVHLLRLPQAKGPVVQSALDAIDRQVGHMVRLVDDLLDLSRINTGKVELRKERVSLGTIIDHAVQTSAPLMQKLQHEFVVSMPPDALWLIADRTADRSQGGHGIGLTPVRSMVEMHGGSVSAHSERRGSEFVVRLPIVDARSMPPPPPHPPALEPSARALRVIRRRPRDDAGLPPAVRARGDRGGGRPQRGGCVDRRAPGRSAGGHRLARPRRLPDAQPRCASARPARRRCSSPSTATAGRKTASGPSRRASATTS